MKGLAIVGIAWALIGLRSADDCDLKSVKSGLWCDSCSKVLEKKEITSSKYCRSCNEGRAKKERTAATKVKVCVKKYYVCAEHEDVTSLKAGKCTECKKKLVEKADTARVTYACQGCGAEGKAAGACKVKECKKGKKKIVGTCAKSGTFPHVKGK